ncbi:MAG: 30S ribosomal protein S4 [Candidatus Colwellbacteria bacterium]|nr:30S ribosomal protein S4 [Candidatus Colwellbacteria bacterium]MBI3088858.1 30S ribosomal protein S4 [Candidatus Colwellbacteria bacterium]
MPRVLEKKERSLGIKLSIRGERSVSPKAALIRKPYRPGQHGKRFRRSSEFGDQLREKQKIKFSYSLTEAQLKRVFQDAARKGDSSIEEITEALENRLDNIVMRLGFVESRSIARQFINHGHILVNNRKAATHSYRLKVGDTVSIKPQSRDLPPFRELAEELKKQEPPSWLSLDKENVVGKMEALPRQVELPFNLSLVVDYYSKK